MRNILTIAISAGAFITACVISCTGTTAKDTTPTVVADSAQLIKNGEYLVTIMGCDDCHSPKRMGAQGPEIIPELRLSGYPASRPIQLADSGALKHGWALLGGDLTSALGPWGMSFAGNITSDESGIGSWTEEQFNTALRKGKYKGAEAGRGLLPPMPWMNYKDMKPEDMKALFAFLKSTKPVKNIPPAPIAPADVKY